MLLKQGQTIGKNLIGIEIVGVGGVFKNKKKQLVIRYSVFILPSLIPLIGPILGMVNILAIFEQRKQCLHDIFGRTIVIKKLTKG